MVLPRAGGPRQGCGVGATEHPASGGMGTALRPHLSEGPTALGHVSGQLCLQPFLPELPRTRVSPAGHGRGRAKDLCPGA